jgi:hypothetical protein
MVEEATFINYHNWKAYAYAKPASGEQVMLPVLTMIVNTQGLTLFNYFQAVSNLAESGTILRVEFIRDWRQEHTNRAAWWRFKDPPIVQ